MSSSTRMGIQGASAATTYSHSGAASTTAATCPAKEPAAATAIVGVDALCSSAKCLPSSGALIPGGWRPRGAGGCELVHTIFVKEFTRFVRCRTRCHAAKRLTAAARLLCECQRKKSEPFDRGGGH